MSDFYFIFWLVVFFACGAFCGAFRWPEQPSSELKLYGLMACFSLLIFVVCYVWFEPLGVLLMLFSGFALFLLLGMIIPATANSERRDKNPPENYGDIV